jgi:hypothetical protein
MDSLEAEGIVDRMCKGMALITYGKLLLWIDFVLVLTIGSAGLRDGSNVWTWWMSIEAIVGVTLIAIGAHIRGTIYE